jgi:hypothetical protein
LKNIPYKADEFEAVADTVAFYKQLLGIKEKAQPTTEK